MKKLLLSLLILSVGLSAFAQGIQFNKKDVCVIRNIELYKYPKWPSQITLHSGQKANFCSPKSMLEFYYKPGLYKEFKYLSKADIKEILVTDHTTLDAIDATKAFYVYGSNETSPAGDDLVTFRKYSDAKNFAAKHNGKRVFTFKEVSHGLIKLLNGLS